MNYLEVIKTAVLIFPFVALIFTMPFILIEYHRYGSISTWKSFLIYLFVFYLICAYFLVILPLPKISEVAKLTTPTTQFIPFQFMLDFFQKSGFEINNIHTYLSSLKTSYFYIPLFNIILTIPFGMFLRYFRKLNLSKTIFYTFLLSLFFELTQLTGLYFIYPRGYRLFDVDDLILNTFGGLVGYFFCFPLIKIIPGIDIVNAKAREKGKNISGLRRTSSFILDIIIWQFISNFLAFFWKKNFYLRLILFIVYYFIIPFCLKTSTLGQKFLNIQIEDYNHSLNYLRLVMRRIIFIIIYILIPWGIKILILNIKNVGVKNLGLFCLFIISFSFYFSSLGKYLFTKKELIYEKISKTRMVSTIK